jgi:hypothetical protein
MKHGNKKNITAIPDIFSRYRAWRFYQYLFSTAFAFVIAFSLVSAREGVDVRGLLANVAQVDQATVRYDADIILRSWTSSGALELIAGNTLQKVDRIELTLLGDPAHFRSLRASSSDIQILSESAGIYQVSIKRQTQDILPWQTIASFIADIDTVTQVALVDTDFISGDVRYHLSNKVEE